MKLHLPIKLRAALLAVLVATVSPAFAGVELNIGGTPQLDWESALEALEIEDDLTLTITDGDALECFTENGKTSLPRESTKVWSGQTTLTINGGSFTMSYMYMDGANITIDHGGSFTASGYSEIGYGKDVTLVLNDGTVDVSSSVYFGTGSDARIILNGGTFTATKIVTFGQSTQTSAASAYIEVNEGAVFMDKGAGVIGDNTPRSSAKNGAGSKATIVVNGGEFSKSSGHIGFHCDVDVTVKNGGHFVLGDTEVAVDADLSVTVESGGVFTMNGNSFFGLTNLEPNTHAMTINVDGGRFELTSDAQESDCGYDFKTVEVMVDHGGEFYMEGGIFGDQNELTSITVKGGSTFTIDNSISKIGLYSKKTTVDVYGDSLFLMNQGILSDNVYITLGADAKSGSSKEGTGEYTHKGGAVGFNGYANIVVGKGGVYNISGGAGIAVMGGEADIVIENGGVFNQSGGIILNNTSTDTASITIDQGGVYNYWSGTLGSTLEMTVNGTLNLLENAVFKAPVLKGSGVVTVQDSAQLALGNASGSEALQIFMKGGSLSGAGAFVGHVDVFAAKGMTADMDMGGLQADRIDRIRTNESISLTGLAGNSTLTFRGTENYMTVGSGNAWLGEAAGSGKALLQFDGAGSIAFESDAKLTLLFDAGDVLDFEGDTLHICLTNGSVTGIQDAELYHYFKFGAGWGASIGSISSTSNGDLIISVLVDKSNVWRSSHNDGDMSQVGDDKDNIGDYGKVVVDTDTNLTLGEGEEATLRQMEGNGNLHVNGSTDSTVHLENGGDAFDASQENGETHFRGNLEIEGGSALDKTGSESFVLDGNLSTDGNLKVTEGVFSVGEDSVSKVQGGIVSLGDEETNKRGDLRVDGYLEVASDSDLTDSHGSISGSGTLHTDGTLTVGEDVSLNGPQIELGTGGVLDVTSAAEATVGGLAGDGTVHGDLMVQRTESSAGAESVFSGSLDGNLTVGQGANQTLAGLRDSEESNVAVQDGGKLTVKGSDSGEVLLRSISNGGAGAERGALTFSASADSRSAQAGSNIHVKEDIVFWNGASTELRFNMNSAELWNDDAPSALMLTTDGTIYIERQTSFKLSSLSKVLLGGEARDLTAVAIMQGGAVEVVEQYTPQGRAVPLDLPAAGSATSVTDLSDIVEIEKDDLFYILFEKVIMYTNGQTVYLDMVARTTSAFDAAAETHNSRAGANLLWAAQQSGVLQTDANVLDVALSLNNLLQTNPGKAQRVMAAIAGSTTTALGAAQRDALKEQLTRVRWHAAQVDMALPTTTKESADAARVVTAKSGLPAEAAETASPAQPAWVHTWVEGTYSHAKLNTRGDESGYRLNSWGGSFGVDMDLDRDLRVGVAITALYGDVDARAMDTAKGDLDSYYLSLYSRYRSGMWGHTALVSGGLNQAKLNRTVDYASGSYSTRGKTEGYGLGAMYELTYDFVMDDSRTALLQPLFNVSVVTTRMGSYSEQGAGGTGLHVGDQKQTTTTMALGARWLQACGAEMLGRMATFELRANVAQDLGDHRGEADVALLANPGYTANVVGAKVGRTALQAGISLAVPVSDDTRLHLNANADLRENMTSWNASVGVSIRF